MILERRPGCGCEVAYEVWVWGQLVEVCHTRACAEAILAPVYSELCNTLE